MRLGMIQHRVPKVPNQAMFARERTVELTMTEYVPTDCPLLHDHLLISTEERDSLREYLASQGVFCSLHRPVHPYLLQHQDTVDIMEVIWIRDHALSLPLGQEYGVE